MSVLYKTRKVFQIKCSANTPEMALLFDKLAHTDGWRRVFEATDGVSGESVLIIFEPPNSVPEAA